MAIRTRQNQIDTPHLCDLIENGAKFGCASPRKRVITAIHGWVKRQTEFTRHGTGGERFCPTQADRRAGV